MLSAAYFFMKSKKVSLFLIFEGPLPTCSIFHNQQWFSARQPLSPEKGAEPQVSWNYGCLPDDSFPAYRWDHFSHPFRRLWSPWKVPDESDRSFEPTYLPSTSSFQSQLVEGSVTKWFFPIFKAVCVFNGLFQDMQRLKLDSLSSTYLLVFMLYSLMYFTRKWMQTTFLNRLWRTWNRKSVILTNTFGQKRSRRLILSLLQRYLSSVRWRKRHQGSTSTVGWYFPASEEFVMTASFGNGSSVVWKAIEAFSPDVAPHRSCGLILHQRGETGKGGNWSAVSEAQYASIVSEHQALK